MRFLLVTSRSRRMFEGGRSFAIRFISSGARGPVQTAEKAWNSTLSGGPLRGRRSRSTTLPNADRGNLERLPVLGDRASSDDDALLAQDFGDLAVRQRALGILRGDQ